MFLPPVKIYSTYEFSTLMRKIPVKILFLMTRKDIMGTIDLPQIKKDRE